MTLSVVTTLYASEATVEEFHRRMARAAEQVTPQVEFVYVNDGSPDGSLERVLELRREDARIAVIDLARNFGHHPALLAGLKAASGEFVFLIDSDLEEAPELLPDFWGVLQANPAADAVYGIQRRRKGGVSERLIGRLWYAFFCRLTDLPYPRDSLTARLMTRRFVAAALLHKERDLDMMGIFAMAGHEQIPFATTKASKGDTSYTVAKRLRIAITGLTSFTTAPLTLILLAGCLMTIASVLGGLIWLLLDWSGAARFGLVGLAIWSIWFVGGLLLTALGVVALYAGTILREAKARPRAIVRHVYRSEES
jgi:putative glycosyltransferase